jgi:cytokinin riboside 5'-monophosphate phosphoribohydrolase
LSKNICIYCSSSSAIDEKFFTEAGNLCRILSENGYNLIYGGGKLGLMGHCAAIFKRMNRHVTGIIPEKIHNKGITLEGIDELIITETMSERKSIMIEKSDAYLALPGGFGTLEEILEVITLKQLGYHGKPVIFYNSSGFYDFLIKQFEHIYNEKFAKDIYHDYYFISDSAEEIIEYLNNYKHKAGIDKWF